VPVKLYLALNPLKKKQALHPLEIKFMLTEDSAMVRVRGLRENVLLGKNRLHLMFQVRCRTRFGFSAYKVWRGQT
jgi:hypothetical protein